MKLKIGNVEIANPFVLAPMAGVTDLPFPAAVQRTGSRASGVWKWSVRKRFPFIIKYAGFDADRRGRKSDRST